MRRHIALIASIRFLLCGNAFFSSSADAELPDKVLRDLKTRAGLIVHIGCGDGGETAGFAADGRAALHVDPGGNRGLPWRQTWTIRQLEQLFFIFPLNFRPVVPIH